MRCDDQSRANEDKLVRAGPSSIYYLFATLLSALTSFATLASFKLLGLLDRADQAVLQLSADGRIENGGPARFSELFRDITALGSTSIVTVVTVGSIIALKLSNRTHEAVSFGLIVLSSSLLDHILKELFGLSRPGLFAHETIVNSPSFPSGHTLIGSVTYLTLGWISTMHRRRSLRALSVGLAGLVAVAIGASRIYLGVHWPSDVIASWLLAISLCSLFLIMNEKSVICRLRR